MPIDIQLFQHYLLKKLSSRNCFCTFTKNHLVLFVWLFLVLCPVSLIYVSAFPPIPYSINYYSYVVKSWNQANWFFLLIVFLNLSPFAFHINLKIILFIFYWKCVEPMIANINFPKLFTSKLKSYHWQQILSLVFLKVADSLKKLYSWSYVCQICKSKLPQFISHSFK